METVCNNGMRTALVFATAFVAANAISTPITAPEPEQPERGGLNAVVTDLRTQIGGRFRSAMLLLAAAAGAVLLIACANLSTLLLAKSPKRQQEMAVRSAFGANRRRMLRQLLIESLILALPQPAVDVIQLGLGAFHGCVR